MLNRSALALLLVLPLAACEKKPQSAPAPAPAAVAPAAAAAPAPAATVGDDPAIARLPVGTKTHCAVSGEDFTVKPDTVQVTYAGKRYAFCCPDCQPTFTKNPTKYAAR